MSASPHVAVIGAGITGLTAAHRLRTASPGAGPRVTLLEASERLGGWVRTERFAGRAVDYGPDSLLARSPWARELCEELGLADRLVAPGAGASLLLRGGRLRVLPRGILAGLPGGPRPFVRAGLLGPLGVARAALDLVLPENGPPAGADESVGALIRRRFGGQALERVIDPLLGGVHAGRCDELSLRATAPHLAAGAAADRSLLRGLRAVTPPAPAGAPAAVVFEGPREGMQTIADALADRLRDDEHVRIACGSPITDLAALPGDVGAVILATPAAATARLLEPHAPAAAVVLRDIRHATIAHVTFAFDPADLPLLPQATGFLVPAAEGLLLTACTFVDRKWPLRPRDRDDPLAGTVVLRCSAGRSGDRRAGDLDDDRLAARLLSELSSILDVRDAPRDVRVRRFRDAMPQYAPGHLERIDAVTDAVRRALPQVELAGATYRGSSVPQCIRDGRAAADAVLAQLADTRSIGEGTTS